MSILKNNKKFKNQFKNQNLDYNQLIWYITSVAKSVAILFYTLIRAHSSTDRTPAF